MLKSINIIKGSIYKYWQKVFIPPFICGRKKFQLPKKQNKTEQKTKVEVCPPPNIWTTAFPRAEQSRRRGEERVR